MRGGLRYLKLAARLLVLGLALVTVGCEGTDTRNQVDDTVEELAGKKDLDRYQQMKNDLNAIETRQSDSYQQLKEASENQ